ncbi:hypothetical protein CC85DRAFT_106836 [Cutaneotrichosporon oleaginosum]|uniref:Uncharacterized protein n=1 Tax=Cutaneotrichosporon oleaginosum TaxID=879819 RepID=A0A0J0XL21_9TREE|nr:uncharacterized protein CC85DRAFT_106836 [Cutaneotrichosporon oleaginosum]KLT41767.1 hypothetical protein CC85DRAFT_106836 [Cutaneotrichosporon oleaginosum]TXT12363.1 hypothetical protein COLE_02773 [Cutaneotrichosporon oleaginosum]
MSDTKATVTATATAASSSGSPTRATATGSPHRTTQHTATATTTTTTTTTPSPPQSARTASPVHESGASAYSYSSAQGSGSTSHRTPTPVSPQYTFGGHTPISPQSFASGTTAGLMPNPLAVPEADELPPVLEGEREVELASPPTESPEPPSAPFARTGSPDSVGSHSSMGRTPTSRSHHSGHSSWQYHDSRAPSSAAINIAHKQRVSQAPPLPDHPYTAPPSATNRPLTPTAATSLLAAAASSLATPTMSATRLSTSTMASSVRRKSRTGAKSPLGDDDKPPVPPLPSGVMYTPSAGPSAAVELKAAIDAGEAPPHYAFLDQDPTETEENSPPHGGVMTFSGGGGGDRRASSASAMVQGSSPHSSNSARKHLSFQSQHSDAFGYGGYQTSSSMADVGDSSGGGSQAGKTDRTATRLSAQSFRDQWASFAGGPAPAWGKRESNRFSMKSYKSGRSTKSRNAKRRSNGEALGRGSNETDEWVDDDEADLLALMRRAAVLERLLRHGKRASNMNANPRMVQRYSHWSIASTSLSNYGPSRVPTSRSRSGSPEKYGQTPPPPRRSASSATTHTHRSKRSATSSLRHRLQRKLGMRAGGREFQEVGSDDGADQTEPDMTVEGMEDDSSMSIRTPHTPIRRAFSTSFSQQRATPSPGAGAGIIVFPELAALPPLEPPRHDGEVCAQACLPPSVAVPYTPLPPPPEAKRDSRVKSKHSRTLSGTSDPGTSAGAGASAGVGAPQRSLHSLKNLRHAFDEKAGGGFSDNRASMHSGTVLMGDVPTCDQRFGVRRARRLRILVAVACLCGIILIVGLLAGLLSRRNRQ